MNEVIDTPGKLTKKKRNYFVIALIGIVLFAISSGFALDAFWKYEVNQRYPLPFFSDAESYQREGLLYFFLSLGFLLISTVLFILNIRQNRNRKVSLYGMIALLLLANGFVIFFNRKKVDPDFMEYMTGRFFPIWAILLSILFAICAITAFTNRFRS